MALDSLDAYNEDCSDDCDEDIAVLVAGWYAAQFICKEPCRTSTMTGRLFIQELLMPTTNERRFIEFFRMGRSAFLSLKRNIVIKGGLIPSRGVSSEEQLAIFLYIIGQNSSNRSAQERFQHSGETISR